MRLSGFAVLVVTSMVGLSSFAGSDDLCGRALKRKGKMTFGAAARQAGIQYFMIKTSPELFAQLLKSADGGDRIMINAEGFLDPKTSFVVDHSLIPLFSKDIGRYAHQLIRNGSDSIGMGVRWVTVDQWRVGLLFPPEILDTIDFEMIGSRNGREFYGSIRRDKPQYSSAQDNANEFAKAIQEVAASSPYPDSYDVHTTALIRTSPGSQVALDLAELVWIPAPLLNTIFKGERNFPGRGNPLVPPLGEAFSVRISAQTRNTEKGWTDIPPPKDKGLIWFDPKLRIGTWFNVVPDWALVAERLAKDGGEKGHPLRALRGN